MAAILRPSRRARRHGAVLAPVARRSLERSGWRTTLEYCENHERGLDGRLLRVEPCWTAEAERFDGGAVVVSATGPTADAAWEALAAAVASQAEESPGRLRVAPLTS